MSEFIIHLGVGCITACGDVEIMKFKILVTRNDFSANMTRMVEGAKACGQTFHRQFGNCRRAVIALHPRDFDKFIACINERLAWE